ncbi:hypothetical protein HNS38_19810 [Lentimicrobium sp. L6]|uniref:hypothetical protein n=1 Tax=Lentimicrobium sp. L6 TaxID=2735916 RepID=UPI001556BA98|nr:hypothetical protein [Lentimicrobium sp. L6]NPD87007.1 hypothetical protein [Lentimicrobium sp. L6]
MTFNYKAFTIPVISIDISADNEAFEYNDAFKNLFLRNKDIFKEDQITFSKSINSILKVPVFHWNGIIYHINMIKESETIHSYLISPSENSVALSFLWLKHDLINILNPIIGFSDILSESNNIHEDDAQLIDKIKSNSQKFYEQVQKIAALQLLTLNDNDQATGKYLLSDFLLELNNKLRVEKSLEEDIHLEILGNGHVSDRISNPDFRFAFEEHFSFLTKHQNTPSIKMKLYTDEDCLKTESVFEDCILSNRQFEDLINVELYISKSKSIKRLQSDPLNYLLLCELLTQIGGNCEITVKDKTLVFMMSFPILETLKYEPELIEVNENTNIKRSNPFDFPPQLLEELQNKCSGFHGFMILDDWEAMTIQMESINKNHQDTGLVTLIKDIDLAIQSFDVEKLKTIYKKHQLIFSPNKERIVST